MKFSSICNRWTKLLLCLEYDNAMPATIEQAPPETGDAALSFHLAFPEHNRALVGRARHLLFPVTSSLFTA